MSNYRVAYDYKISGKMTREQASHVVCVMRTLELEYTPYVVKDADDEKLPLDQSTLETACYYLMTAGKKIAAIKLYRWHTSLGLRESKEAVEKLYGGGSE